MGRWWVEPVAGRWWWSPDAQRLHGLDPDQLALSSEVVASFYRPDDWRRWWSAIGACAWRGEPFALQMPLVRADGATRWVTTSGEREDGDADAPRVGGQVVDVTGAHDRVVADRTHEQLEAALASRQVVDQAKGALMLAYGLDPDASFELLRWCSQHAQTKLAVLARRLVDAVSEGLELRSLTRTQLDDVLQGLLAAEGALAVRDGAAPLRAAAPDPVAAARCRVAQDADGAVRVDVAGEVDLSTVAAFAAGVGRGEVLVHPPRELVVDLRGVTYLGSSGVAVLVAAHRRCGRAGTPLRLVLGSQLEVLDVSGLQGLTITGQRAAG